MKQIHDNIPKKFATNIMNQKIRNISSCDNCWVKFFYMSEKKHTGLFQVIKNIAR